jgi:thioredoxin-related protein
MKKLILVVIVATLAGCFGKEPVKSGKEGKLMPQFSMLLTDSVTWLHSSEIKEGKSSVILYFSPTCPYCKKQTKEIIKDIDKLKDIQFYFISNFPISRVKKFSNEFGLDKYSNIKIGSDSTTKISNYFEITGIPYIAIYSNDKTLKKTYEGIVHSSQIKEAAEK